MAKRKKKEVDKKRNIVTARDPAKPNSPTVGVVGQVSRREGSEGKSRQTGLRNESVLMMTVSSDWQRFWAIGRQLRGSVGRIRAAA